MALGLQGLLCLSDEAGARWEGQEARASKDGVCLRPDPAHAPAQLPSYSSEPHKANKYKDY